MPLVFIVASTNTVIHSAVAMTDDAQGSLLKDIDTFECDDNNTVIEESSAGRKKRVVEYLIHQPPRNFTSLSSVFFFRNDDTIEEAAEKALRLMPEISPAADFSQFYVLYKQRQKKHMVVADLSITISSLYDDKDVMYITNNALYFKEKKRKVVQLVSLVSLTTFALALYIFFLCLRFWLKKG